MNESHPTTTKTAKNPQIYCYAKNLWNNTYILISFNAY